MELLERLEALLLSAPLDLERLQSETDEISCFYLIRVYYQLQRKVTEQVKLLGMFVGEKKGEEKKENKKETGSDYHLKIITINQ